MNLYIEPDITQFKSERERERDIEIIDALNLLLVDLIFIITKNK